MSGSWSRQNVEKKAVVHARRRNRVHFQFMLDSTHSFIKTFKTVLAIRRTIDDPSRQRTDTKTIKTKSKITTILGDKILYPYRLKTMKDDRFLV